MAGKSATVKSELPDSWNDAALTEFDASWGAGFPAANVGLTLVGGPDGDVTTTWRWSGKHLTSEPGVADDVAVAIQVSWADAAAILEGSAEPAVLFMQGKLKSTGDNGVLLRLLKASSNERFGEWRTKVRKATGLK